jgi:hypothetical protein
MEELDKKETNLVNSCFYEKCINTVILKSAVMDIATRLKNYEESELFQYEIDLLLRKDRESISFKEFVLASFSEIYDLVTIQKISNSQTRIQDNDLIIFETCLNYVKAEKESNNYYHKVTRLFNNYENNHVNVFVIFIYDNQLVPIYPNSTQ